MDHAATREIEAFKAQIAQIRTYTVSGRKEMPAFFGLPEIDNRLPGNGLRAGLHEVAGFGPETERAAAPAVLVAGILAQRDEAVLWVQESPDTYPQVWPAPAFPPSGSSVSTPAATSSPP